ncbi:hypothetical protein HX37_20715 [Salmonella enterica]|uniref:Uncharacterized protein n=1 Tax=Salmonella enterica TaxID=28901 RepID=A0A5U2F911_SALER|nr:hypothetical protein [Salmonella enterica]
MMKSIKVLATCLLFLFSFSVKALDADINKWYDDKIENNFKRAELKYPNNQSLQSFKKYYHSHKPDCLFTDMVLRSLTGGKVAVQSDLPVKKLSVRDACAIFSRVRKNAYLSAVTPGKKGYYFGVQAAKDARRILLSVSDLDAIVRTFKVWDEIPKMQEKHGIEGTADEVFNDTINTCAITPVYSLAMSLPALIVNNVIDFSPT